MILIRWPNGLRSGKWCLIVESVSASTQVNKDAQYTMGGTVLNTTVKENDLGWTISAHMKVSKQCGIAAAKGNQIIGLIMKNVVYKEKTNNTAIQNNS